ncbi:hypothetical protein IW140_003813 [Coemansia sp. RSA 1813]|nr:hypothetical protein EV178_004546 [Coemansia sp. RSA 1646]KAJ1769747.1 hypothetical protein LPJ74_003772 [Coemansia sp. RSA 1843]KAJ2090100.1 hypothetical protein IW138_002910 [Coemansia sp. RSA 986]KAJ2214175.1 hypothetical protein EV179_003195 [Coemansia sp. RSA 487]KAJ2568495.1 hypothetical protein IW140_003813 [Coemansia sp. RSA 1813]
MKIFAAVSAIATLAAAAEYSVPATNDVGIIYTSMLCGKTNCPITNLSGMPQYMAYNGNRDIRNILMGFDLPEDVSDTADIESCMLELPKPITSASVSPSSYTLTVSPVTSAYDAKTVTAATAPKRGPAIATETFMDDVAPNSIDITEACKNPVNGQVAVSLNSIGSPVTFPSSTGGSSAKLVVKTK